MNALRSTWKYLPYGMLDRALQVRKVRTWMFESGLRQLHRRLVEDRQPSLPSRLRYQAVHNLFRALEKGLSDGRIGVSSRRALGENVIGSMVTIEEHERRFRERYGYEPPSFLTISPTKKCNLKCLGCYAASSSKNAETLTYPVLRRLIREKTEQWGSRLTVISGGEPFLYHSQGKGLLDVVEENPDNYFLVFTNGTLITKDAALRMAELGNITPAISVEGWEKETDARRGRGIFQKILSTMDMLRNTGIPFGISVTATRHNAELLLSDDFIDFFFSEQGALYGWLFQYMPIGRSAALDLMVSPEQRRRMLEREMQILFDRQLFYLDFWNGGPITMGCIAAGRPGGYFYVDWNGDITPCVFFPYAVANIYQLYEGGRDLRAVLESPFFKSIRSWQDEYAYRQDGRRIQNLFMPCSIRDHYAFAHEAIRRFEAKPTDESAKAAMDDENYRKGMIEYDRRLKSTLDPIWEHQVLGADLECVSEDERQAIGC